MKKRECRKCGALIPNWVKIDGVQRNLCNRKFCLECSPYRGHNTSSTDPVRRVKRERKYKDYSEKSKETIKLSLYRRALERQRVLIGRGGGKCLECGYHKSKRALCFHHREPSEKEFGLTLNNLWSKKMEVLIKEQEKCDLLCANCHMELEDEISIRCNGIVTRVNAKYGTDF